MADLNKAAALVAMNFSIHACTDVTGFGLSGHSLEMALGSGQRIRLKLGNFPLLGGVEGFIKSGYFTRANKSNREYAQAYLTLANGLDPIRKEILFDPQTSGGLLFALPKAEAPRLGLSARLQSKQARVEELRAKQRPLHHTVPTSQVSIGRESTRFVIARAQSRRYAVQPLAMQSVAIREAIRAAVSQLRSTCIST